AGVHIAEIHIAQRLHRCKHVLTVHWPLTSDQQLTEPRIAQNGSKDSAALLQDFVPVRYEQQLQRTQRSTQVAIIKRCNHRLARPCRSDDQVGPVPMAISFDGQLFENLLLIWKRSNLELSETGEIYAGARHAPAL